MEYSLFENQAITDISNHYAGGGTGVAVTPLYYFKNKVLFVSSSLDQAVAISIMQSSSYFNGGSGTIRTGPISTPILNNITIPTNSTNTLFYFNNVDLPVLGMLLNGVVRIKAACTVAPTTGVLTARIIAWN